MTLPAFGHGIMWGLAQWDPCSKEQFMEWDATPLWDTSHQGRNFVRATMGAARRNQNTLLLQSWELPEHPALMLLTRFSS